MSRKYAVVDEPDSDVLDIRVAISDLMMRKRQRPVVARAPAAAVADAARKMQIGIFLNRV
jgi:hypothetical protein